MHEHKCRSCGSIGYSAAEEARCECGEVSERIPGSNLIKEAQMRMLENEIYQMFRENRISSVDALDILQQVKFRVEFNRGDLDAQT